MLYMKNGENAGQCHYYLVQITTESTLIISVLYSKYIMPYRIDTEKSNEELKVCQTLVIENSVCHDCTRCNISVAT